MLQSIINVFHVIICLFLVLVVLLQEPRVSLEESLDQLQEDLFLGIEIEIERSPSDTGFLHDIGHGGHAVALARKHLGCSLEYLLAPFGGRHPLFWY